MKFKQLLSKINVLVENAPEATFGGGLYIGDPQGAGKVSALTDKGTFNLQLPRSIDAINALLHTLSNKDYIDPDGLTGVVKQKLNHFGLDFSCSGKVGDGENVYELVQYGSPQLGVYGQNPYDDVNVKGFKQGDGIKEKLGHSLNLVVNVQRMSNGLRRVEMIIVPAASSSYNNDMEGDCGCEEQLEENIFQKVKNVVTGQGFRSDAQIENSNKRRAESAAAVAEVQKRAASLERQKKYDEQNKADREKQREQERLAAEESNRAERLARRAEEVQTRFGGRIY